METSSVLKEWRNNPVKFVRDVFSVEPDAWQQEALMAFAKHNRISMKACKGPGKTTLLSWCSWNFLLTRPFPKVAATSISWDNLSDGLWTEMAKWQNKSELLKNNFTWTKTRIFQNDNPETWWMSARTWSKSGDSSQQADTLAGLHADYLLFIIDEAGGVPDAVMAAAEAGLATGVETKLVIAGNPTNSDGPLYRSCTTERNLWYLIEITSDPDDPNRTPRVSIDWAKEQIQKYGKDNPWVLVNVFGKFPPSSLNTLLGIEEIVAATKRGVHEDVVKSAQKRLGVDVARFGDDRTTIFPRQGLLALRPVVMRNARSNEIAARVMQAKSKWGSEMEFIDGTGGYGSGVVDSMIQAGLSPQEIHFSSKAIDTRYHNKRSEMWFLMSEWIKRGGCIPDDPDLVKELSAPTYTFQNGKFLLEPKDQIKDRIGVSPDLADALALTFALPELPSNTSMDMFMNKPKVVYDYDPFAGQ